MVEFLKEKGGSLCIIVLVWLLLSYWLELLFNISTIVSRVILIAYCSGYFELSGDLFVLASILFSGNLVRLRGDIVGLHLYYL